MTRESVHHVTRESVHHVTRESVHHVNQKQQTNECQCQCHSSGAKIELASDNHLFTLD
jgi:hypothetical protein